MKEEVFSEELGYLGKIPDQMGRKEPRDVRVSHSCDIKVTIGLLCLKPWVDSNSSIDSIVRHKEADAGKSCLVVAH